MNISKPTLEVLKNFATINTNILVREGNTLATISNGKNIFSRATVSESFDKEFAIYDLNSLLGLLTFTENPDLDLGDESLKINSSGAEFEYYYADPSIIVAAPDKTIEVDNFYEFSLSKDEVTNISRAASVISAPVMSVVGRDGKVTLSVGDPSTPRSNTFRQVIGETDKEFDCRLAVENFKVIADSYKIVLSQKKFMFLENEAGTLKYWLALEPNSVI
jgi:hypothetical protein